MAKEPEPPCEEFVPPPDGKFSAYCHRCNYSKKAHEMWPQWTAEAEAEKDVDHGKG